MGTTRLRNSIHRILLLRITIATVALCAVFAAIAYYDNQQRLAAGVAELAQLRANQFSRYSRDLLDGTQPPTAAALSSKLEDFIAAAGPAEISTGHFVLVRIYDLDGNLLLDTADDSFTSIEMVRRAVDQASVKSFAPAEIDVITTRLDGEPFVAVTLPMQNSAGEILLQIVGVFALSPAAIAGIEGEILRTILYVIGLILLTSLTIYPVIAGLINQLSVTAVKLLDSNLEILRVLGGAIAKRDSDTDAHNYRVSIYSVRLAEALNLSRAEIRSIIKGALLHDVGKLGIRDNILLKPGKLDEEEFAVMKTHVEHGLEITARASWLADAQNIVGGHHEKYDGAGYPAGLSAEAIPLAARIFAITDVFDALTSRRPYKEPMSFAAAMDILEHGRGSHFDPALLDAFSIIAADLYRAYSGSDDHEPRQCLEDITANYFKSNMDDLLV